MKTKRLFPFALAVILVSAFFWPAKALATHAVQLIVDDDNVECPNARFTHIQDAVDAASPGDEIHICKGIYAEQVTIRKPLDNETFATSVFDGIRVQGSQSNVRHNQVFNGAESGIFISGNNNVVTENTISEAMIGILKDPARAETRGSR